MLHSLFHVAIDPVLNLAFLTIRTLITVLPILIAFFVLAFFADIFYYFLTNASL
jgi:hypothetical protein